MVKNPMVKFKSLHIGDFFEEVDDGNVSQYVKLGDGYQTMVGDRPFTRCGPALHLTDRKQAHFSADDEVTPLTATFEVRK